MAYTAEKLAAIFGCTVSDLMDINRGILLEQSRKQNPFSIPKLVDIFIAVCPINKFGKHLLLNRTWYAWCRDELWKRHTQAEKAYKQAADERKKAARTYWQEFTDGGKNWDKACKEYDKASKKRRTRFEEMVAIELAILRCGFVTKESDWGEYIWMALNIDMLKNNLTPEDDSNSEDEE